VSGAASGALGSIERWSRFIVKPASNMAGTVIDRFVRSAVGPGEESWRDGLEFDLILSGILGFASAGVNSSGRLGVDGTNLEELIILNVVEAVVKEGVKDGAKEIVNGTTG